MINPKLSEASVWDLFMAAAAIAVASRFNPIDRSFELGDAEEIAENAAVLADQMLREWKRREADDGRQK